MSKKKDPNIILRDKRLRALAQRKKNAVKETAGFGCPFLGRMVDEVYEIMERVIKLEHFVWKVELEPQKDAKTGETYAEIIVQGPRVPPEAAQAHDDLRGHPREAHGAHLQEAGRGEVICPGWGTAYITKGKERSPEMGCNSKKKQAACKGGACKAKKAACKGGACKAKKGK